MSCTAEFDRFIRAYYATKGCQINGAPDEVFAVVCPDQKVEEYTYEAAVAKERKVPLLAPGSAAFQQILKDCQEDGVLCQITLKPKEGFEQVLRGFFRDTSMDCRGCEMHVEEADLCLKPQPCHHKINNGKIVSVKAVKAEPARFFQFYYSLTLHNRLRQKSEETIAVLVEEKTGETCNDTFDLAGLGIQAADFKSKVKTDTFEALKMSAEQKVKQSAAAKLALFDLPLCRARKAKLKAFQSRLRKERKEQVISKRHDFDYLKWQNTYEALLKREEESYETSVSAKFTNLLVVNTQKVKCQLTLDNEATVEVQFTLGMEPNVEVTCPICKKQFTEGFATRDSAYVCSECTRQSIDTGKMYSKKARLTMDEKLNEYFESDAGFVCSVCGKKFSRLQEFKCSHDGSSVCLSHFDRCDDCGKVFSKNSLTYTDEFKHQLCPKHAKTGGKNR